MKTARRHLETARVCSDMQRTYDAAIVLVHHASKKHHAQPGQALRGSSDLHAFGDSNAYLARRKKRIPIINTHNPWTPSRCSWSHGLKFRPPTWKLWRTRIGIPSASLAQRALFTLQFHRA